MSESLGTEFPKAQERAREYLLIYQELGPCGAFGALHIRDVLHRADKAVMEQDLPAMIRIYQELKDIE